MAGFRDLQLSEDVSQRLLRCEPHAVEEAYRIMAGAVMGLALRLLNDRGLAEEVVQDTFVELVEKADQIRDPARIVGWVRRVAVNHCLMRLRSPWHARRDAVSEPPAPIDAHSATQRYEGLETLQVAFGSLTPEARTVVWLHDVEGYTHKEIGALLGKSPSFSKSQLARSYEKLLRWHGRHQLEVGPDAPCLGPAGGEPSDDGTNGYSKDEKSRLDNFGSPCIP